MLPELMPLLESESGWYGSLYFERRSSKSCSANLKQTQISDQLTMGVVLRIYDGFSLHEQATDDLDPASLKALAIQFAERVRKTRAPEGATRRGYRPPAWKDRLAEPLDAEIASQIPTGVAARTPVHFGIRYQRNPLEEDAARTLERLKGYVARAQALAPECGLAVEDLTYILARQSVSYEESIFVDRETWMSQALYRVSLTVVLMSGADRSYQRLGGLGGLEAIELGEGELRELLSNLKALRSAERLAPGRYRVLFGPVVSGVLAHEAFGHSQEGDTCARGRSKAWELHHAGVPVGNRHATILNNPAVFSNGGAPYAAWGSYFFDEEGWLAREQVLLDAGVLRAPMTNLTSALRLGVPRTANGKRENWASGVYTRQTNTYFSPGDRTYAELVTELGDGFIALHPAGGMEDPKGMGIQVGISFLEEVKSGKKTGRVFKGPAGGDIQMTGYTPEVLQSIVSKSKIQADQSAPDQARHPFNDAGGCGKYHKEFVFAGCGGPYMLLDHVTLG